MTALTLRRLWDDAVTLMRKHGRWAFVEFAALGVLITTLHALLAPGSFLSDGATEEGIGLISILSDPVMLTHEAVYALLFGLACLRIWYAETGGSPHPLAWFSRVGASAAPLMTLSIAAGLLTYVGLVMLLIPGLIVLALTALIAPAILIEGRGWRGLARSCRMTARHLPVLTIAWGALAIPAGIFMAVASPAPSGGSGAEGMLPFWTGTLLVDLISAVFSAASLSLVMALYIALVDTETGGRDTWKVFR